MIAYKQGILEKIHFVLNLTVAVDNFNKSVDFIRSGLVTLGSLLRHFPLAQKHFFSSLFGLLPPGFELLQKMVANKERNILRRLILVLLNDLYIERVCVKYDVFSKFECI